MKYDIAVLGCGIAGSMAAVAAARHGAKVIAIDEAGFPGGALTSMGTGPMMTFHAGNTQVVRGIPQEMIERMQKERFSPGHVADSTGYTYSVTPFSAEGLKIVLEQMMIEAGVFVLYHTSIYDVVMEGSVLKAVKCFSCGKKFEVSATVFIDSTGDGDIIDMSGVPFKSGRDSDGKNQPMTMNFKISGVDTDKIRQIMNDQPEVFPFLCKKPGLEKQTDYLSVSGFCDEMKQGIKNGEITFDRDIVLTFETDVPGEMIVNMSRINGEDPIDPISLTKAEIEGRRQIWEILKYLKKAIPGYEKAKILFSGPNVGIRSSRRMVGLYELTADDIINNRMFEDTIAVFGYPMDVHSADGVATNSVFLKDGSYYGIPYRCLVNAAVPNLLAAGRNISCSFQAQGSTRVSPCCAALGEAAGCAAFIAASEGCLPTEIDVERLKAMLLEEGAFLG